MATELAQARLALAAYRAETAAALGVALARLRLLDDHPAAAGDAQGRARRRGRREIRRRRAARERTGARVTAAGRSLARAESVLC